jgi:hypothetical protein
LDTFGNGEDAGLGTAASLGEGASEALVESPVKVQQAIGGFG